MNILALYQLVQSFFASNEKVLLRYYETNAALVKDGFDLESLKNMPIHEYHAYVRIHNAEVERKNNEAANASGLQSGMPPMRQREET
jgi:hypothetical protein